MPDTQKEADALIREIIPAEEVKKLEHGRTEEILQPLLDLGYIKTAHEVLIPEGIRLFRKDYLELNLIPEFAPNFLFLPLSELEGEELDLLHTLTALDGDFELETLPEIDETNLCSRIIHYRLSIHRLYTLVIDDPFSKESLKGLKGFRGLIKNLPPDSLSLINLLGNIPALIQHLSIDSNGGLNKKVVAFEYQKSTKISRFAVDVTGELLGEVAEDDGEAEEDNETEMLRQETDIDNELKELKKNKIFDNKEQEALADESRKTRRRRSRLLEVSNMANQVHAELESVNAEAGKVGEAMRLSIQNLEKVQQTLNNQQKVLSGEIQQKEQFIKNFSKGLKRLDNKERELRRKIKRGAKQSKIDKLKKEIDTLKKNKKEIEKLAIEKSDLNVRLLPVNEELKAINKKLKKLKPSLQELIEKRNKEIGKKQGSLQLLLKDLNNLEAKVNKIKFSFRGRMRKVLDRKFYEKEVLEKIFKNRDRQTLKTFRDDPLNKYLIHLIQIFQWTNGYYYGKLDGGIGDRTFSALDDMANYSKQLRLKFILARLDENHAGTRGYWILNIKYLFNKLADILKNRKADTTTKDLLEEYESTFIDGDSKSAKIGNEATDQAYEEIVEENQEDIREGGKLIRRIYYGIKSIASTLLDALKDIFRLIKSAVKKLIYLVKNLVKIVYKEIREGVRKFKDGMKFLFGKRQFITPTASGSAILTKFDFDFDTLTFTPPKASDQELSEHTSNLFRFSNNLDFALVLTAKVLKWTLKIIKIGTPLGWARLALQIAIQYKRMILKWLVSIGKKLIQRFISIKYKVAKTEGTT